jgi:hypothetical protein
MIDFFASLTVGLIIIMTLVILYSNHRQARALNEMKKVVQGWVDSQMRDRREERHTRTKIADPLKWFGGQVNLVLTDVQRKMEEPPAIEFLAEKGMRLVVSPFPPGRLREGLKATESRKRKLKKLVEPLLGHSKRNVKVLEKNNSNAGEWFDLEAEAAAKALQAEWPACNRLWFYVISPGKAEKEPWISLELSSQWNWIKERKAKVTAWFKAQLSKSSS